MLNPTFTTKSENKAAKTAQMTAVSPEVAERAKETGAVMHAMTFWTFGNKDIDRQSLEDAWVAEGLDTQHLPAERNPKVSLSRAVSDHRGRFTTEKYTGQVSAHQGKLSKESRKTVKAIWYMQISYVHTAETETEITPDEDLDFDDLVGRGVDLHHESMIVWLRADGVVRAKNMATGEDGKALPMTEALTKLAEKVYSKYQYNQNMLDSAKDMSGWLSAQVRRHKATLVRPQGGLYLVLAEYKNQWERVARAVEAAFGKDIVYALPIIASDDTSRLVLAALTAEYEDLAAKITREVANVSRMRSDGIKSRNKRIAEMVDKLSEFEAAMDVSTQSLRTSLDDLKFALDSGQLSAVVPEGEKIDVEQEEPAVA